MKPIKIALLALAAVAAASIITMAGRSSLHAAPFAAPVSSAPAAGSGSGPVTWMTDFVAAQKVAKAEQKSILLDFTGSDWCPWCMKLDHDILTTPDFREFARKHLVLVKVDFPRHHPQSAAEQAQNEQLATRFQVEGYPTLVAVDSDGHKVGTLGYTPGGPDALIGELSEMISH